MRVPSRLRPPGRPAQGTQDQDPIKTPAASQGEPAGSPRRSKPGPMSTLKRPCLRPADPAEPPAATLPVDAERMLAATLALMTRFYRTPHAAICRQLLDNLALLGRHPGLSSALRSVCLDAQTRWLSYLEEVECTLAELAAQRDANGLLAPSGGDSDGEHARTLH